MSSSVDEIKMNFELEISVPKLNATFHFAFAKTNVSSFSDCNCFVCFGSAR